MNIKYIELKERLLKSRQRWLITGGAGFIGSNLLETLLSLNQEVVVLDNFSTGHRKNLEEVQKNVGSENWSRCLLIEGDIIDKKACADAVHNVDIVLHQAALGSVTRSIEDPLGTNSVNVDGFLNMLFAAKEAKIERFVYASSSSVYGDHPGLPKIESEVGNVLSPYALSKKINEQYAKIFSLSYGFNSIGLRYFNVFGARQDPNGPYAAVIPLWIKQLLHNESVYINGDGETSRDFCYIENVVSANILAAMSEPGKAWNQVYNIAAKDRTTLKQLFILIRDELVLAGLDASKLEPKYRDFRKGDIRHSFADISKAEELLGYQAIFTVRQGLSKALQWYKNSPVMNGSAIR